MTDNSQHGSMTIGAAAFVLGVSRHTVRRMLDEGELDGYRFKRSGHRRIHVESVRKYIGDDKTLIRRLEIKLAEKSPPASPAAPASPAENS